MKGLTKIAVVDGVDVLFDPGYVGVESSLLFKREYEFIRFTIDSGEHEKSTGEFLLNIHFAQQYEVVEKIVEEISESSIKSDNAWTIYLKKKYKEKINTASE